jgi:hypothetical protein
MSFCLFVALLASHVQPLLLVVYGRYVVLHVVLKAGFDLLWYVLPPKILPLSWFHFLISHRDTNKYRACVVPIRLVTPASKPLPLLPCLERIGHVVVKD